MDGGFGMMRPPDGGEVESSDESFESFGSTGSSGSSGGAGAFGGAGAVAMTGALYEAGAALAGETGIVAGVFWRVGKIRPRGWVGMDAVGEYEERT